VHSPWNRHTPIVVGGIWCIPHIHIHILTGHPRPPRWDLSRWHPSLSSSTLNSSILQSLTSTMRQTQARPQTSPLAQSQTYSQAQWQQQSQQAQTYPGQIKLPPGFMYDYGPPLGPSLLYEMFGFGAQQQVGSLSVQFGCALLWLMSCFWCSLLRQISNLFLGWFALCP